MSQASQKLSVPEIEKNGKDCEGMWCGNDCKFHAAGGRLRREIACKQEFRVESIYNESTGTYLYVERPLKDLGDIWDGKSYDGSPRNRSGNHLPDNKIPPGCDCEK